MELFSIINTRIIVTGLIFIATVLCSAPLYGWGEYSNYKGTLDVFVSLTVTPGQVSTNLSNVIEATIHPTVNNTGQASNLTIEPEAIPQLCRPYAPFLKEPVFVYLSNLIFEYFQSHFDVRVRKTQALCAAGKAMYILRANNEEAVNEISGLFMTNELGVTIRDVLSSSFMNRTGTRVVIATETWLDVSAAVVYKEIYIPFQGIGVCTLDFTTVNRHTTSSILYILVTTIVTPYAVIFFCGVGLCVKHYKCRTIMLEDYLYVKVLYICGFASLTFCIPYYVTNFLNANGALISVGANFFSTMLFYMTPMCITVPYWFSRLSDVNIKERILAFKSTSSSRDKEENHPSNSLSVKVENV